jgi:hypothetical protein
VGKCQTISSYSGSNSTPQTPQISGSAPVIVDSILRLLEDGLDFALSLGDAEAAVDAIMGMAAVRGLAADRLEVIAAVAAELE